eukprot:599701-Rhodomonas_salina.2
MERPISEAEIPDERAFEDGVEGQELGRGHEVCSNGYLLLGNGAAIFDAGERELASCTTLCQSRTCPSGSIGGYGTWL